MDEQLQAVEERVKALEAVAHSGHALDEAAIEALVERVLERLMARLRGEGAPV